MVDGFGQVCGNRVFIAIEEPNLLNQVSFAFWINRRGASKEVAGCALRIDGIVLGQLAVCGSDPTGRSSQHSTRRTVAHSTYQHQRDWYLQRQKQAICPAQVPRLGERRNPDDWREFSTTQVNRNLVPTPRRHGTPCGYGRRFRRLDGQPARAA